MRARDHGSGAPGTSPEDAAALPGSRSAPLLCTVDGRDVLLPGEGTASMWHVLDAEGIRVPLGCGSGHCGSCTVLVDDVPVPSCLVPHAEGRDRRLATVATAAEDVLVAALARHGAVQCGFCSPGIVVTLSWTLRVALAESRAVTADEVRETLTGHLCRCTGYVAVVTAAVEASRALLAGDR